MPSMKACHWGALARFVPIRTAVSTAAASEPPASPIASFAASRPTSTTGGLINATSDLAATLDRRASNVLGLRSPIQSRLAGSGSVTKAPFGVTGRRSRLSADENGDALGPVGGLSCSPRNPRHARGGLPFHQPRPAGSGARPAAGSRREGSQLAGASRRGNQATNFPERE